MNIHDVVAPSALLGEKLCMVQAVCATAIYTAVKENSGHGVQLTHTPLSAL